ncbi:hypothetical protein [Streptomyces sp. NPDC058872]|uniref:hypothetical protein n=1 Tax=Streptomyces sp. NPDC058872 TaxID=3346661 RepID=UPI0036C5349A
MSPRSGCWNAITFQRARITPVAESLRPAGEEPVTQVSLDPSRPNRLRPEPAQDRIDTKCGRRLTGPAGPCLKAG